MKISLIRHGRPATDLNSRIVGSQFETWLRAYDAAEVDRAFPPPDEIKQAIASCRLLLSSPATRALTSADLLGLGAARSILSNATEAPLPTHMVFPIPLKPVTFTIIARVLWLLGLARASESRTEVRDRAHRLAAELVGLAGIHGHIALVSHGYLIRFLKPALETAGWRCTKANGTGYWSASHFEKVVNHHTPQPDQTLGPVTELRR